jgi:hypothetical protein
MNNVFEHSYLAREVMKELSATRNTKNLLKKLFVTMWLAKGGNTK